jgi:hypothetical protein
MCSPVQLSKTENIEGFPIETATAYKWRTTEKHPMTIRNLLDEKEAAEILGLSVQTLRNDRATKRRIPYVKIGKSVRYKVEDIAAVIEAGRIAGEARQ